MKRLFRPETAFFVLAWLGLSAAFRDRAFADPGALWHIKVGEIVLDRGIPQTDPFSYTFEGAPWVPQQWGAEVLMALAHRAGGLDFLLLGFTAGLALLYTLLFRRCVQGGMGPMLAAVVVGGVLFVGAFHYYIRPHMFTIALLAWTMACVIDFERGRATAWRLAGQIPLYVLWTNLHGGVLGGTMTLGCAVAGWGLVFLARERATQPTPLAPLPEGRGEPELDTPNRVHEARDSSSSLPSGRGAGGVGHAAPEASPLSPIPNWRTAFLLACIVGACALTPFVNPHGTEMIRTWQKIVGSKVLPELVSEHKPLDPTSPLGLTVLALGAVYLLLLGSTLRTADGKFAWPRVSWLIPLVWLALSFKGIRQGPLFAVCAGVAIADLWKHTFFHRYLLKNGDGSTAWDADTPAEAEKRHSPLWAALLVPALLVAISSKLIAHKVEVPLVGAGWARLHPKYVPTDLNDAVREYAASVPPGTRVFNDANLGGYLMYHAPELKIFMDDRCELYGDEWIRGYSDTLGLPPAELGPVFEYWAQKWQFERALIQSNGPGAEKLPLEVYLSASPKWREVARGQSAVMYARVP
jgi:hypothetical protein